MPSPMYVKWLLLSRARIDIAKQRYPYFARFVMKYISEKHPQWYSSIENHKCYFCDATFQNEYLLKLHLTRTKCSVAFENMIRAILSEWSKFKAVCGKLRYRKRKDTKQVLLQMLDNDGVSLNYIYEFCMKNS
jgi:hypothetical protein